MIETQQTLENKRHKIQSSLHRVRCLFEYKSYHPVCNRQDSVQCQMCKRAYHKILDNRISVIRGIRISLIKRKEG